MEWIVTLPAFGENATEDRTRRTRAAPRRAADRETHASARAVEFGRERRSRRRRPRTCGRSERRVSEANDRGRTGSDVDDDLRVGVRGVRDQESALGTLRETSPVAGSQEAVVPGCAIERYAVSAREEQRNDGVRVRSSRPVSETRKRHARVGIRRDPHEQPRIDRKIPRPDVRRRRRRVIGHELPEPRIEASKEPAPVRRVRDEPRSSVVARDQHGSRRVHVQIRKPSDRRVRRDPVRARRGRRAGRVRERRRRRASTDGECAPTRHRDERAPDDAGKPGADASTLSRFGERLGSSEASAASRSSDESGSPVTSVPPAMRTLPSESRSAIGSTRGVRKSVSPLTR